MVVYLPAKLASSVAEAYVAQQLEPSHSPVRYKQVHLAVHRALAIVHIITGAQ